MEDVLRKLKGKGIRLAVLSNKPHRQTVKVVEAVFGKELFDCAQGQQEGVKRIAVCAPAFSADCIETLEEIQGEIREAFEHAGGQQFTYIPCLNHDPAHLDAIEGAILRGMGGWV